MRVGVTGASGYVGGAVLRRLGAAGHTLTALVRPGSRFDVFGVQVVRGDVRDPAALRALAEASDAVVHAAAYVHRPALKGRDRDACFAVNAGATRALVAALATTGRTPGLVFVSTVAVYGATFADAAESTAPRPDSAYGASKLEAEQAVLEAARAGAIRACVLRPAVVYGPHAPGNTGRLAGLIDRGVVPSVGGGRNRKSLVHVDDLAHAIERALDHADGRTYNVAGDPLTVREIVTAIAAGRGRRPRWVPVPRWAADAGGAASRLAARLTGGAVPDLTSSLTAFMGEATVDSRAIRHDLGVAFRPTAEGLAGLGSD